MPDAVAGYNEKKETTMSLQEAREASRAGASRVRHDSIALPSRSGGDRSVDWVGDRWMMRFREVGDRTWDDDGPATVEALIAIRQHFGLSADADVVGKSPEELSRLEIENAH